MKHLTLALALVVPVAAMAAKPCEELKTEIAAKIDAAGVKGYTLEIVKADADAGDAKVVGRCDAGQGKIVYRREAAAAPKPAASEAKAK
jgi:hypothetical protein